MDPELESGLYVETIIYEIAADGSHTTISRRLARTDFVPAAEAKGTDAEVGAKLATVLEAAKTQSVEAFKRNPDSDLRRWPEKVSSLVQKGGEGVGTTSVSIPVPAGAITAGSLLAIFVTTYNSSTISAAGWAATDITPYLHMLLKTAAGGESAVTVTLSGSPGATNGWMEEWSGVDVSDPIHGSIVTKEDQTNATVTFGAYSTSAANISVVGLVAIADNETVNSATYGNLSEPRGYAYENYDSSSDVAIGRLYGVQASAGSVGAPTMTLSASDTWDSAIFGWNNAAAGGSKVPAIDNTYRQRRAA